MTTFDVCITITSSIFVIAYPILVEVISRLDEKYNSTVITDLFNNEHEKKVFNCSFFTTTTFTVLYLMELKPFPFIPKGIWLINNSAITLLSLSSLTVVIVFIFLINKIFIYYRQIELVRYLIKKHGQIVIIDENDYNNLYFSALSELQIYSIKIHHEKIAKEISSFIYSCFKEIRNKSSNADVIYPNFYYAIIYKIIEELSEQKSKRFYYIANFSAGSVWLLGEFEDKKISDLTYNWIWQNQRLSLSYDKDDFLLMHWQNAHQYFSNQLSNIQPEFSSAGAIVNQQQVDVRIKERESFFFFHTVLGSLVLYLKKYSTLRKMFDFTQSIPPRYLLLPETMGTIFAIYFKMANRFDNDTSYISSKYPFPDFHGLNADDRIKGEVTLYLGLLYLRQYSIVPHLVYQKPVELPQLPETQGEKKSWAEQLPYFTSVVEKILNDRVLLSTVEFDFITDEYCASRKIEPPLKALKSFQIKIAESIEDTEEIQEIDEEKKSQFLDSTKTILTNTFETYSDLTTNNIIDPQISSNYINGTAQVYEKSAFAKSQGFTHMNFDTFLAGNLAEKFKSGISESFYLHKSEQYLVKQSELENALSKLNISGKNITVLSFGRVAFNFPGVRIISYDYTNSQLVGNCFFILKNEDLPLVQFNPISEEFIKNYQLVRLNEKYNLYASLIDLHKNPDLHDEIKESGFHEDVEKQVLANIYIDVQIKWRNNIKCLAIKIASPFKEEGIITELNDIVEFVP